MAQESLKKLRARASMSLRNGDFEAALAAYRELALEEPRNPVWSQRRAEIYYQQGRNTQAIKGFEHALGVAIDVGEIICAIAICKQILAIDPDHTEALDRLQLLYIEPQTASTQPAPPTPALEPQIDDAPLEEVLLTEMVPGAAPQITSRLEDSGIVEIPLTEIADDAQPQGGRGMKGAREQLMATPLFGSLDAASLRGVIEQVKLVSLDEGEVLFRQGDPADTLYIVADGAVVPIAEEETHKKLAVLEAGSFFGEIGLMTDLPRNATIRAIVDSRLLAIDRKAMWVLIRKHPAVLKVMLRFLRDRLVDRLTRTNALFSAFPARQRPSVARLFRFLEVRSGSALVEQGRPSESLYALLAGSAQVIQMGIDSDRVLAELEPGSLFGEMSLLDQTPASAAVVTTSKCWVLALSRDKLERLTHNNPEAEDIIRRLAEHRESENNNRSRTPLDSGQNS
ncbi:MAG: cyclic nucleotide-binding domain-containing protein [bacterium]|nr:cyclic nucleotide-binding domain-containing protein [bacterium]